MSPSTAAKNIATSSNPVIQEIKLRMKDRNATKELGHKLGLVVEGGGMRGVISGGALVALAKLGLTKAFDEIHTESAGALNSAYFLASQAELAASIYIDDLTCSRFINLFRLRKIVNIDYLIDEIVAKTKLLNCDRVLNSRTKFFVSVTSFSTGGRIIIDVQKSNIPLIKVLKATSAIVPLYNKAVNLDDAVYVDGGIADPIPVMNAIESGCTHILVLLTRPPDFYAKPLPKSVKLALKLLMKKWSQKFAHAFIDERVEKHNRSRDIAFGRVSCGASVHLAVVCPEKLSISRLTKNRDLLILEKEKSQNKMMELLAGFCPHTYLGVGAFT